MAINHPPYPYYKHSGIEWLGSIPTEWHRSRLKYEAAINMGQSPSSDDCNQDRLGLPFLQGNAEFGFISPMPKQYCEVPRKVAEKGNFLFSVRAPVGALNIADQMYGIGRGLCAISNDKELSTNFLWWLIPVVKTELDSVSTGSTFEAVSAEQVENVVIFKPTLIEQEKIANFLDYETAKIDTLIEKQEQLIKLLKEKRQAVISHAVTKGLNPNAPMRDSGVEWLGEVPKHWEVTPLKHTCKLIDGDRSSAYPNESDLVDEGIPFVSSKNIVNYKFTKKNLNYITPAKYKGLGKGKLEDGDLVITVRGTIGHVGIFDHKVIGCDTGFINAQMMIMRPKKGFTNYLQLVSESSFWLGQLDVAAYGSTVRQLSNEILGNVIVAVPPICEIQSFISTVKKMSDGFEELVSKAEIAIMLMQERRTALISAAVTGKIDVRNWKEPKPINNPNKEVTI